MKNTSSAKVKGRISAKVNGGEIVATLSDDPNYPGIDVEFVPDDDAHFVKSQPRVLFEMPKASQELRMLVWEDPQNEDYTQEIVFQSPKAAIVKEAEKLDWSVSFETQKNSEGNLEKYAEFSQCSPAGEDFSFCVFYEDIEDLIKEVIEYAFTFDVDEHVEMWLEAKRNGVRGVPSVCTLVNDAKEIETMLADLADALRELFPD